MKHPIDAQLEHMLKGEFEKALQFFEKALQINDKNVVTINDLGCCYCHLNKFEEAISMFKKASSINPDYRNPYFNLEIGRAHV